MGTNCSFSSTTEELKVVLTVKKSNIHRVWGSTKTPESNGGVGRIPNAASIFTAYFSKNNAFLDILVGLSLGTHLFLKVPRPGDSEVTFSAFESSCHLLLPV